MELMTQHWGSYGPKPMAQLAEALLPMFEKLLQPGTQVTDEIRDLCEGLVAAWIFRQP